VQDVAERSRQKSEMLQGYGDTVLRAETLEEQLVKSRKRATAMQSKLDTAFAKYAIVLLSTYWKYLEVV
jgi:chaperonin cofactor prefoldin